MLRLLERTLQLEDRLMVLAPPRAAIPGFFRNPSADASLHAQLLREVQRLRGTVYLQDGAVTRRDLSSNGLHQTPEDERSWHLLMLNHQRQVSACIWYLEHENTISLQHLRVRSCPLARMDGWRDKLQLALDSELLRAQRECLPYSEVGGWAVSEQSRRTSEGLLMILATFGLSRVFGGALGVTTATVRHSSAAMLRRLGLSHFEVEGSTVPAYFDPKYNCDMELLRFDTRQSNPKYHGVIEMLRERLADVAVVGCSEGVKRAPRTAAGAAA